VLDGRRKTKKDPIKLLINLQLRPEKTPWTFEDVIRASKASSLVGEASEKGLKQKQENGERLWRGLKLNQEKEKKLEKTY
jgi:hypothetical protein